MASGVELVTNPWQVPPSNASWAAVQSLRTPVVWHSVGMWKAWMSFPCPSGFFAVGAPSGPRVNPSPLPMRPRMLSNEWFSIITTTMCSISGT